MTTNPQAVELLAAVGRMADTFDHYTCSDIGPALTCREAEALFAVLLLAGCPDSADALITAHAESDDEGDADHSLILGGAA